MFPPCRKKCPGFVQKAVPMFAPSSVRKWVSSALPRLLAGLSTDADAAG